MQTVYIDSLFLINTAINYVLMLCTAKICGITAGRLRIAAAGVFGGVYAVSAIFFNFLNSPALKIACGIIMVLIVFGSEKRILRVGLIFFAVSAAFGGSIFAVSLLRGDSAGIQISVKTLIISFALCYAVFAIVFRRLGRVAIKADTVSVTLSLGERSLRLTALRDTGNSLTDTLTGKPLIIISREDAVQLLPPRAAALFTEEAFSDPVSLTLKAEAAGIRLRLLPYSAVGIKSGLLPAFRLDSTLIDGKRSANLLAAVSPTKLSDVGAYSALVGV